MVGECAFDSPMVEGSIEVVVDGPVTTDDEGLEAELDSGELEAVLTEGLEAVLDMVSGRVVTDVVGRLELLVVVIGIVAEDKTDPEAEEDTPEHTWARKQGLDFVLWKFWQQFPHIERDFVFTLNCFLQ